MASYNRVVLMGNFTRDVEVKHIQSGTAVATVGLAVNEKRKGSDGSWIEDVTFVDLTLWGRTAEVAGEYLGKGSPVLIEGRLKLDQWEKDGQKRSMLKVVVEDWFFPAGGGGNGSGGGSSSSSSSDGWAGAQADDLAPAGATSGGGGGWDEDIPF